MRGKRIQEEVMSECFQNEKRTFDERIVVRQILIVPDKLTLQGWRANGEPEEREYRATYPIAPPVRGGSCDYGFQGLKNS